MAPKGTITDGMIQELLARPWGGGLQSDIVKSIATGGDFLRRGVGAVGRVAKDIESVPAFAAAASLNYLTGGGAQGLVDKRGQALENTMNRYGLGDNTTTIPTKNISISPQSNQVKPTMPSPAANQPAPTTTPSSEPAFGSREWATSKFKSPDEAHAWLDKHIEDSNTKYAKMSNEDFKKMVGEVNDYTQSNKPGGMGWIEVQGEVPKGGQKFTRVINQKPEAGLGLNRDLTANELHAIAPILAANERNDLMRINAETKAQDVANKALEAQEKTTLLKEGLNQKQKVDFENRWMPVYTDANDRQVRTSPALGIVDAMLNNDLIPKDYMHLAKQQQKKMNEFSVAYKKRNPNLNFNDPMEVNLMWKAYKDTLR